MSDSTQPDHPVDPHDQGVQGVPADTTSHDPADNRPMVPSQASGHGATPDSIHAYLLTRGEKRQLVLVKHGQRYIFRYAPGGEAMALDSIAQMARDPGSDLDWYDAAVLCHQMGRGMGKELTRIMNRSQAPQSRQQM